MRFPTSLVAAFALSALSLATPTKRQIVVDGVHGTTVAPPDGSPIAANVPFAFDYRVRQYCESGYSPISVYLSTSAPADADVTTSGGLADGSYVYHFGDYLVANFGLPQMGTPPPPTLTAPELSIPAGATAFFTVVETYIDCPGHIHLEYGVETTTVVYA